MSADNWGDCPQCKAEGELREDYELGILGGKFYAIYSGKCHNCDFEFKYEHNEEVK